MVSAASQVDIGRLQLMGAPGFRFYKDLYPEHRAGGLNYYPYSSIKSGFTPGWTVAAADPVAAAADITVAVAPGTALIDAQDAALSSAVNLTFTPEDLVNGDNFFRIFANPTRLLQPVVAVSGVYTPPTTRLNGDPIDDGDRYAECVDFQNHLEAHTFFKREAGMWKQVDPSFEPPDVPTQQGRNRVFGNKTARKLTASNFMVNMVEAPIYIAGQFPIYGYSPARANLRNPASLEIATVKAYYHVLPLNVTADFTNGSTSVTLDYAYRSLFADVAASVSSTATLAIDGAALAAAGYNAATGVITLAAAYAGTTGTAQVLITPVTAGNNFLFSVGKSELIASANLTNP